MVHSPPIRGQFGPSFSQIGPLCLVYSSPSLDYFVVFESDITIA